MTIRAALAVGAAVGAMAACASFDEATGDPAAADGGGAADGGHDGGGATDARVDPPDATEVDTGAGDAAIEADAGIAPFPAQCQVGDTMEAEPNDTTANPFLSSVCGSLTGGGDVDTLQITLSGSPPVTVAFSCTGNGKYSIQGPGVNYGSGAKSGGGFSAKTFPASNPPGTYVIRIQGSEAQAWRLVVRQ